jgi:hypothetical protein
MDVINMTGDDEEPAYDEKLQLELALAASMEPGVRQVALVAAAAAALCCSQAPRWLAWPPTNCTTTRAASPPKQRTCVHDAAPTWRQQNTTTTAAGGEVDTDDEVMQRALAESMRTYEQEQQTGTTGSQQVEAAAAALRKKRTSAGDDGEAAPGSLKRQRSSGLPLSPGGSSQWQQQQRHIMLAPSALQQQVQQQQQLLATGQQRGSKQQQPGGGFGRSGSVQDLQQAGADDEGSDEQQQQQQQQHPDAADHDAPSGDCDSQPGSAAVGGGDHDWALHTTLDAHGRQYGEPDDDALADVISSSSDTSIAHSSGLPHTNAGWARRGALAGRGALGGGGGGHLVGPALVPGERNGAWRLYGRQFYPTQAVYWQEATNGVSCAGRVLSVAAGEGGPGQPLVYMVEVHHPLVRYVEVTAQQLHPQLRRGDLVWAKPGTMAPNTWSTRGPLFDSIHGQGGPGRTAPSAAPWMLARVHKTDLFDGRNPIAEVVFDASPSDSAYVLVSQLELVREIGESSSTAAARSSSCSAAEQQQQQQQPAGDGEEAAAAAELAAATALHDMAAGLGDAAEELVPGAQVELQQQQPEDDDAEEGEESEEEEAADAGAEASGLRSPGASGEGCVQ